MRTGGSAYGRRSVFSRTRSVMSPEEVRLNTGRAGKGAREVRLITSGALLLEPGVRKHR